MADILVDGYWMIGSNQLLRLNPADWFSRGFALLLALAVQLLLISMFSQHRERSLTTSKAMTLIETAEQRYAPVEIAESFAEPVPLPESIIEPLARSPIAEPSERAPPTRTLRTLDKEVIAAQAVAKIIEEENRRHLDGRKPVTILEPTVPSIFEQPRRSLGDVEHDPASDTTTIWHSENCFTRIVPEAIAGPSFPNYRQCMFGIGKPKPRGNLFEHLRAPKPLPEARPGVPVELAYPERSE